MRHELADIINPRLTPRQLVWALVALAVVSMLTVLITTSIVSAIKSTKVSKVQETNTETLNYSKQTLDILQDCIQATGKCFKRNQRATQGAVENITKYAVYAAVCVDEPGKQTVEETTACIIELIRAEEVARKGSSS